MVSSFVLASLIEFADGDFIRLCQQRADSLKSDVARRKDADKKLRGIIGVRQDGGQGGEIVVADVNLLRSKQRLERLAAHADIQTINAWAVEP